MKEAIDYPSKLEQVFRNIQTDRANPRWHARAVQLLRWDGEVARNPATQSYHPTTYELLMELFRAELASVRKVAKTAACQLRTRHQLDAATSIIELEKAANTLASDELFHLFLTRALNTDLALEDFLKRLRRHLWQSTEWSKEKRKLAFTIAEQAWHTEFIWTETENETTGIVGELNRWTGDPVTLAKLAMYRPLTQLNEYKRLLDDNNPENPARLIQLQIANPIEECKLGETIPSLGEVIDPINSKVQKQYETHPYPNWFKLVPPFPSIQSRITRSLPNFSYPESMGTGPKSILVAGGGTGQHPLRLALGNPDAEFLCLDLSRASLSYAKRKAQELEIKNIDFLQGDLLDLKKLGRTFDHIDTIGTLHHIGEPKKGWQILSECLNPGGTFHVGVYSEIARLPVHRIREEISTRGIGASKAEMKAFREELIHRKNKEPYLQRLFSHDFFSLSGLTDLLFHRSEYCYRLPEIVTLIKELQLTFLAFHSTVPEIHREWKKLDESQDNWDDPKALAQREMTLAGSMALLFLYMQKPEQEDSTGYNR